MPSSSKYREEFVKQARKLCLLGATADEMANFFEVHRDTIFEWQKVHPDFAEAVRSGKDQADAEVAHSLYRRAKGYSHPAVKIVADAKTHAVVEVPFTQHYPPDTVACIFWLKNRQRAKWRDKPEGGDDEDAIAVRIVGGLPD